MPLLNGNFLTPGIQRYEAASWMRTANAPGRVYAAFAGDAQSQDFDGKEGFEAGWGARKFSFTGFFSDLEHAYFDFAANTPKTVEDFEDLWGSGPAIVESENEGPYALSVGQTLLISIMDAPAVIVTFAARHFNDIADARPEEVANVINEVIVGARATTVGKRVAIVSDRTGPTIHLRVTGGTANADHLLKFDTGEVAGAAEGATFFRRIEFGFALFSPTMVDHEGFEIAPILNAGAADPLGWFAVLHDPDSFETWRSFTPTLTLLESTEAEHFFGWSGLEMQTFFNSV